jgi:hypothetical protein
VLRTGAELQTLAKLNGVMEDNRNGMQDHQRKKKKRFPSKFKFAPSYQQ